MTCLQKLVDSQWIVNRDVDRVLMQGQSRVSINTQPWMPLVHSWSVILTQSGLITSFDTLAMIQVILGFDHPKETQPYLILVLLSWRVTISLSEYYTTFVDEVPNQDFTHILLSKLCLTDYLFLSKKPHAPLSSLWHNISCNKCLTTFLKFVAFKLTPYKCISIIDQERGQVGWMYSYAKLFFLDICKMDQDGVQVNKHT